MHPETYDRLASREQNYWWHAARRQMAVALLRRHGLREGCRAVDMGCGTGANVNIFAPFKPALAAGVDLSPHALRLASRKHPALPLIRADLSETLPFRSNSLDVVTVFNVLYHQWIHDEVSVLSELGRILRPGGLVLITEPAFTFLGREMDQAAMGRRRYRVADVVEMCGRAKLQVRFASYFTSFGVPLVLLLKALAPFRRHRRSEPADMRTLSRPVNGILRVVARGEGAAIAAGWRLPFGVTLACVAQKPLS